MSFISISFYFLPFLIRHLLQLLYISSHRSPISRLEHCEILRTIEVKSIQHFNVVRLPRSICTRILIYLDRVDIALRSKEGTVHVCAKTVNCWFFFVFLFFFNKCGVEHHIWVTCLVAKQQNVSRYFPSTDRTTYILSALGPQLRPSLSPSMRSSAHGCFICFDELLASLYRHLDWVSFWLWERVPLDWHIAYYNDSTCRRTCLSWLGKKEFRYLINHWNRRSWGRTTEEHVPACVCVCRVFTLCAYVILCRTTHPSRSVELVFPRFFAPHNGEAKLKVDALLSI